jgi:hypothetical protein
VLGVLLIPRYGIPGVILAAGGGLVYARATRTPDMSGGRWNRDPWLLGGASVGALAALWLLAVALASSDPEVLQEGVTSPDPTTSLDSATPTPSTEPTPEPTASPTPAQDPETEEALVGRGATTDMFEGALQVTVRGIAFVDVEGDLVHRITRLVVASGPARCTAWTKVLAGDRFSLRTKRARYDIVVRQPDTFDARIEVTRRSRGGSSTKGPTCQPRTWP